MKKFFLAVLAMGALSSVLVYQNCSGSRFHSEDQVLNSQDLNPGGGEIEGTNPDRDGDGLSNEREQTLGTDPDKKDTDGDGLDDGQEVNTYTTNPLDPDTDDGGIWDGVEVNRGTNPLDAKDDNPVVDPNLDSDNDGLTDKEEKDHGTNKNDPDTDKDGLKDGEEVKTHLTNPLDPDTDDGGATDGTEVSRGTNPRNEPKDDFPVMDKDTDKDGLTDSEEIKIKTDPNNPDTDGDALTDGSEVNTHKTNPLDPDTDDGGVNDGVEVVKKKNPLDPSDDKEIDPNKDTDGDGLIDTKEREIGTDPNNPDTDGDRLKDGAEVYTHRTNPLKADTDNGGVDDGDEVSRGTDPLNPKDDKPTVACVEKTVLGLWFDPKNTKDPAKAQFVTAVTPYTGTLSSVKNYGYSSASAHPQVGPQPKAKTFHAFLYKGSDGLNLTMFSGEDNGGDAQWQPASYKLTVSRNNLSDQVKLSDDAGEFKLLTALGNSRTYSANTKYKLNSDGGVVGPLVSNDFISHFEMINTESWDEAFFVSGGKEISLGKKGQIKHFMVAKHKVLYCDSKDVVVELKKTPNSISHEKDGEFIFDIKPDGRTYKTSCRLDEQPYSSCSENTILVYRNLGVGKHKFSVRLDEENLASTEVVYNWEIIEPVPVWLYGPWTDWKSVGACIKGLMKEERTRSVCLQSSAICKQESETRNVECKVACPMYQKPLCKEDEKLFVDKDKAGCPKPSCVPDEEYALWINRTSGETHLQTCLRVGRVPGENRGGGICASGEARPLKAAEIRYIYGIYGKANIGGSAIVSNYCYRDGQKRDNDKTDITVAYLCKKGDVTQYAANRWCYMADAVGKVILGYKDNGAIHKAGCYYNQVKPASFHKPGAIIKYGKYYIRCDSGPATEFPVNAKRCKPTGVFKPANGGGDDDSDRNFGPAGL